MTDLDDLLDAQDATGLAAAIQDRRVSAHRVLEATLSRIEERDRLIGAFISRCDDAARAQVAAGLPEGPLRGVPIAIKDLAADVAGLPTTRGSRLFADDVADADSALVARFRRAGMIVVGKTKVPEMGKNASTEPLAFGPTRNPHDLRRTAGGSSGGSAAAVAAGMLPIAHGNDGGGSIRIPAAMCGLVGLKPTRGRVPDAPYRSALGYPLAVQHGLTRTVRDAAVLLDIAAGALPGAVHRVAAPTVRYAEAIAAPPPSCRVALATTRGDGGSVDPDVVAAVESAAGLVAELGHRVTPATPSYANDVVLEVMPILMMANLVRDVDLRLASLDRRLEDGDLEPFTRLLYDLGANLDGSAVLGALAEVERAGEVLAPFFDEHDVIITPTVAVSTPELGVLDTGDVDAMYRLGAHFTAMTIQANITGVPAISLPLGTDRNGMPVGVQLIADHGREDLLLALAAQIEAAAPWPVRPVWPPETTPHDPPGSPRP